MKLEIWLDGFNDRESADTVQIKTDHLWEVESKIEMYCADQHNSSGESAEEGVGEYRIEGRRWMRFICRPEYRLNVMVELDPRLYDEE